MAALRTALSYREALKAACGHPIDCGLGGGVGPQPRVRFLRQDLGGGEGLAGAGERRASRGCGCPALESSNEGRVSPRRGLISAQPATLPIDKLFGKRLLQAGRYLVSHKAWMKTVPTEDCDVLMTFPGIHACLPWARLDAAFTASAEMWRPLRAPLRQDPLAPMPLGRHH